MTSQVIHVESTLSTKDNIIKRHSDKETKYAKLLNDVDLIRVHM